MMYKSGNSVTTHVFDDLHLTISTRRWADESAMWLYFEEVRDVVTPILADRVIVIDSENLRREGQIFLAREAVLLRVKFSRKTGWTKALWQMENVGHVSEPDGRKMSFSVRDEHAGAGAAGWIWHLRVPKRPYGASTITKVLSGLRDHAQQQ